MQWLREKINRHWVKIEKETVDVYELHFDIRNEEKTILKFVDTKNNCGFYVYVSDFLNVEYDEIEADSVEEAMDNFEEMVRDYAIDEINYYKYMLEKFDEE